MRSLAAFLLFLITLPLSALELPREGEKWLTVRADDIEIFSNASAGKTLDVARDLLRMREAVGQISQLKTRSPIPTKVFLFASERSYAPYRDAIFRRRLVGVSGVFLGGESANFILLQGDAVNGVDRVVYHELTHSFVRNTVGHVPLWLSEGIAEYYSTFRSAGNEIHIGRPVQDHVLWLRSEPLIPLGTLFAIDRHSPEYNEGTRQGVFYAQSWALTHYLLLGNEARRGQLAKFLELLGNDGPIEPAFRAAFGMTYADLEHELRAYLRQRSMSFTRYRLDELKITEPPAPEPLLRDALLYELGTLFVADGDSAAEAKRFLHESLRLNADRAGTHAALGRMHEMSGRDDDAVAAYTRAAELGSDDAAVYVFLGRNIVLRSGPNGTPSPEQVKKARAYFTRATQLNPASARAWLGVGLTYLSGSEDVAPGIAAVTKARALDPKDEQAPRVLEQLRTHQQVDLINDAIEHANRGNHVAALAILDRVIPAVTDAEVAADAKQLRDEIAKRSKK